MTFFTRFTDVGVLVVCVANLANGGHAVGRNIPLLTGGQTDEGINAFFRHKLRHVARRADELCTFARVKLNVVDNGTNRNCTERQCIARLDICVCTSADLSLIHI